MIFAAGASGATYNQTLWIAQNVTSQWDLLPNAPLLAYSTSAVLFHWTNLRFCIGGVAPPPSTSTGIVFCGYYGQPQSSINMAIPLHAVTSLIYSDSLNLVLVGGSGSAVSPILYSNAATNFFSVADTESIFDSVNQIGQRYFDIAPVALQQSAVSNNLAVTVDAKLTVFQQVSVGGDLYTQGSLVVDASAQVVVNGSVSVFGNYQAFTSGSPVSVNQSVELNPSSSLTLVVDTTISSAQTVTLIDYGGSVGRFSSLTVVNSDGSSYGGTSSINYGSSTLTITLQPFGGSVTSAPPVTCLTNPLPCVHGTCVDTVSGPKCSCFLAVNGFGWSGALCDVAECPSSPPCNGVVHGSCMWSSPDTVPHCSCTTQWNGPTCAQPVCNPTCVNGTCISSGGLSNTCDCSPNSQGPACDQPIPPQTCPSCGPYGNCSNATGYICSCLPGVSGSNCQVLTCPNNCNKNGYCVFDALASAPICNCSQGWTGWTCFERVCGSTDCLNNGTCSIGSGGEPTCACGPQWTGSFCQIQLSAISTQSPQSSSNSAWIIGVAIGCAVGGIVIAVAIVLVVKFKVCRSACLSFLLLMFFS